MTRAVRGRASIVVLGARARGEDHRLADAIVEALARGVEAGAEETAVAAGRVERDGAEAARVDAGRSDAPRDDVERVDAGSVAARARALQGAEVAVVLDPDSLAQARASGVPTIVAVLPGFDLDFPGGLAEADCVVVAHALLVPEALRRGAARARLEVAAPVAPLAFAPAPDRRAAREAAGLDPDRPLVLIPAQALDAWGAQALLVQLSLVTGGAGFLFDVGSDPALADDLRSRIPGHGLSAWMFAEGPDAPARWQVADVVLARADGAEVARALAVGAPLVLLPPGGAATQAADALERAGVADEAPSLAMLAVKLEAALEPSALAEARRAVERLDVGAGAARVAAAVRAAAARGRAHAEAGRRGLPHGLERVAGSPAPPSPEAARPPHDPDLEARIERELEALRRRL